jgi:hypothetical protein
VLGRILGLAVILAVGLVWAGSALAAPTVISTDPMDGAVAVDPDCDGCGVQVVINLSGAADSSSVTTASVQLQRLDGTPTAASPFCNAPLCTTITLKSASLVWDANTTLKVVVSVDPSTSSGQVRGADGSVMQTDTRTFTTRGADPLRVDSGNNTAYVDAAGNYWWPDTTNGRAGDKGGVNVATAGNVSGTADPVLFKTERRGNSSSPYWKYRLLVPGNQTYTVDFWFSEQQYTSKKCNGLRVFSVAGYYGPFLSNFDPCAAAGGPNRAVVKTFHNVQTIGQAIIAQSSVVKDYPEIDAIVVTTEAPTSTSTALFRLRR